MHVSPHPYATFPDPSLADARLHVDGALASLRAAATGDDVHTNARAAWLHLSDALDNVAVLPNSVTEAVLASRLDAVSAVNALRPWNGDRPDSARATSAITASIADAERALAALDVTT